MISRTQLVSLGLTAIAVCTSACSSGSTSASDTDDPGNGTSNRAPSLSGIPPAYAMSNTTYSFTPSGSDPDGDPLSYSISNLPEWATFDDATGKLTGSPQEQHVGAYTDIAITVTDGQDSTGLAPFDIEVVATATGSLALAWTPPTESADGSGLDDLGSYRIRWGTQSGDHPNLVSVNNPGITSFVIAGLAPGTYYLTISAVDSSGNESLPSNEASGNVQ